MKMAEPKNALYATIGTGSFVSERAKKFADRIQGYATDYRKWVSSNYRDLVRRGERITRSIRSSAPVKRATSQTKTAQRQVKSATTSVRKALGANVDAVQASAKKVS
jgi:hypothetical protein